MDNISDSEKINSNTQKIADRLIVGCGGDYGFESREDAKGKRRLWEPLMANESMWNNFYEMASAVSSSSIMNWSNVKNIP